MEKELCLPWNKGEAADVSEGDELFVCVHLLLLSLKRCVQLLYSPMLDKAAAPNLFP